MVLTPPVLVATLAAVRPASVQALAQDVGVPGVVRGLVELVHQQQAQGGLAPLGAPPRHVGRGLETGEIRVPVDGPVNWTARADLAEADAAVLASEGCLDGISPPLVSPDAFTFDELASIASDVTGREIKRVIVSDEEYRQAKLAEGTPPHLADLLLRMFQDAREGVFASNSPTLQSLIGRRPQSMREILTRKLQPASP